MSKVRPPGVQATHLFRSARKLARARRYVAALAAIDQAISLAPSAALYDYRGVLLSLIDRTGEALESFTQALSLAKCPEDQTQIYFHRGLLYGREGLYDQALADMAQARQLHPGNATYCEASAGVEIEKGRTM